MYKSCLTAFEVSVVMYFLFQTKLYVWLNTLNEASNTT
jgi:hypothetical protein